MGQERSTLTAGELTRTPKWLEVSYDTAYVMRHDGIDELLPPDDARDLINELLGVHRINIRLTMTGQGRYRFVGRVRVEHEAIVHEAFELFDAHVLLMTS